ncbi:MAG: pyridoxal phosphate-dependent aminotransferase family protein [Candidatus Omnitrophica bacterium]|nr:pyridoxal phosphate-dependent aminotransferase family protein [Candidatus Omnitrophota bacterium]
MDARAILAQGWLDSEEHTLADFLEYPDSDLFTKAKLSYLYIQDMKRKGVYQYQRPLMSACENRVLMYDEQTGWTREMIMMASNNYLGLATHPKVMQAALQATRDYGTGLCGSPMLSGTTRLTRQLEEKLAAFVGCEDAILFPTGYAANVGAISALVRQKDVVFIDKIDHASIIDGCHLSHGDMRLFKHNDIEHLSGQLQKYAPQFNGKLIAVDGVFSMDGDITPLPDVVALAAQHGARVMIDEAHALGVLGKSGRGTLEHFGLDGKVDVVVGTCSKALGSKGGFAASTKEVVNHLRYYARSYMFSTASAPSLVASTLAALEVIEQEPQWRQRLWENIRYLHRYLKALGFHVIPEQPESAVIIVEIGDEVKLRQMSKYLHNAGIYTNAVPFPAVPRNRGRFRLSVMATHTRQDLDETLDAFAKMRTKFDLAPYRPVLVQDIRIRARQVRDALVLAAF